MNGRLLQWRASLFGGKTAGGRSVKMLGEVSSGRDNNYNLIRMVAASSVLFSHSWPISLGPETVEPLKKWTGFSLGTIAVFVFFAVSGFFITKSFDRRDSIWSFMIARILRIYPALFLVLILTVLIIGTAFTNMPVTDYFLKGETATYVPFNLSLIKMQYALPGVFASNPYGPAINGSLWTLFYEVLCYFGVVALGLCGFLAKRRFWIFLTAFAMLQAVALVAPLGTMLTHIAHLSLPFAMGSAFYVYRDRVPLGGVYAVGLGLAAFISRGSIFQAPMFILAVSYACFWLGHVRWAGRNAYNRLGDYSYGMYIYAFPVQQMVVALAPGTSPLSLAATSFPLTLLLAILSWHLVERPALARRHEAASYLHNLVNRRRMHDLG